MQIDAIEERAGYFRLIILRAFGRAAAAERRIVEIATAAWPRCHPAIWVYHIEIVEIAALQRRPKIPRRTPEATPAGTRVTSEGCSRDDRCYRVGLRQLGEREKPAERCSIQERDQLPRILSGPTSPNSRPAAPEGSPLPCHDEPRSCPSYHGRPRDNPQLGERGVATDHQNPVKT
jgi:hypothetical protein